MSDQRNCGGCHLFTPDEPGGFTGVCRYFPPQLAVIDGRPAAIRPPVTAADGCHIGHRPRQVLPSMVVDPAAAGVIELAARAARYPLGAEWPR